jgi:hypothetical protein
LKQETKRLIIAFSILFITSTALVTFAYYLVISLEPAYSGLFITEKPENFTVQDKTVATIYKITGGTFSFLKSKSGYFPFYLSHNEWLIYYGPTVCFRVTEKDYNSYNIGDVYP